MPEGGQIKPNDSPWASPVVLVTKKYGFCVDYRRLSATIVKDAYPLPRIDDTLRLLGCQHGVSSMDLARGYCQVAMSPDASRKATLVTHAGLFQFRVMPFGLCNTPATFERLMDRVLSGMRWSHCLVCDLLWHRCSGSYVTTDRSAGGAFKQFQSTAES